MSDLAAHQAEALGRIGRLRAKIVESVKRTMPVAFTEAEEALGQRLSEVADDLLGAYLENFLILANSRSTDDVVLLRRLRAALAANNVNVTSAVTLTAMIEALEQASRSVGREIAVPAHEPPESPSGPVSLAPGAAGGRRLGPAPSGARGRAVPPDRDVPPERDDYDPGPADDADRDDTSESYGGESYGGESYSGGDVGHSIHGDQPLEAPPDGRDGLDGLFDDEWSAAGALDAPTAGPLDGPPAGHGPTAATDVSSERRLVRADRGAGAATRPTAAVVAPPSGGDLDGLFDDVPVTVAPAPAAPAPTAPAAAPPPPGGGRRGTPGSGTPIRGPWAELAPESGAEVTTRAVAASGGIKPTLLPVPPKTRQRRTKSVVRASAMPGESSLDVPIPESAAGSELDDALRDRLMAAVCIPRPVFSADLVDLVKSAELVADWESEWSSRRDLSVRFIQPKARHRLRGALIFPQGNLEDQSAEFRRSLWARCVLNPEFRGSKLYELGVLLHRFGEEVVSDDLGPAVVQLRLARPQGLVGVIVMLETSLGEGGAARLGLVNALETMMRERLVQIAVVSVNAEIVDTVAAVVAEEAARHQWTPTMPVTLSKSWEYANSTGVTLPLLGG